MDPDAGGPRVIFVCVGNSCRSQMAEGLFNQYARDQGLAARAESAGTQPEGRVDPDAVAVMAEVGIDIAGHTSDRVAPEQLDGYDVVVTMGCSDRDVCPASFRGDVRDWNLRDPKGEPRSVVREVRDEIAQRVRALLRELSSGQAPSVRT